MSFDITDAKERIETIEESIQQIIAVLERRFPADMGVQTEPLNPALQQLQDAIHKLEQRQSVQENKALPPDVIYQG